MSKLKQKRIRALKILASYTPEQRAIGLLNGCQYYVPETGNRCAVGRLCTIAEAKTLPEGTVVEHRVWEKLPARVRFLGKNFLREIQRTHDQPGYWGDKGMSIYGLQQLKRIERTYIDPLK